MRNVNQALGIKKINPKSLKNKVIFNFTLQANFIKNM